jgi:hypothetical protein
VSRYGSPSRGGRYARLYAPPRRIRPRELPLDEAWKRALDFAEDDVPPDDGTERDRWGHEW